MNLSSIESTIISSSPSMLIIQTSIPLDSQSMLSSEEAIQLAVNSTGLLATEHAMLQFDTDGRPVDVEGKKYTSKGKVLKQYQTPYGEAHIERHVYQSNFGGTTFCPLDQSARIIIGSTPRFSKMVSSKYSQMSSSSVKRDLEENHGRTLSRAFIQDISSSVAGLRQEKKWNYSIDTEQEEVSSIGLSLDGTCMLMCADGYRQAMVGSISLYDRQGERMHTRYTAFPPEAGKNQFHQVFSKEIEFVKKQYPSATYVGVADGAADNWSFLGKYVQYQVVDFFHASEYLSKVSKAAFKRPFEGKAWLDSACSKLKDDQNGAEDILKEMKRMLKKHIRKDKIEEIKTSITYFTNHLSQMRYRDYQKQNLPIGSGVIEAACKVIIKQRLCNSGMKWTDSGAKTVLTLRCTHESSGMWKQFWSKIDRYGK